MNTSKPVSLNLNLRGMGPSATLAINERSAQLRAEGRDILRLGLGQSPFPVPEPVVEELRRNAHQKDYLPVKGLPELRRAVAEHHRRTFGIDRGAEDVLIGPGSKELMFLLQLVYYGDLVIHIFYHPVREFYDLEGLWSEAVRVELDVPPELRVAQMAYSTTA